MIETGLSLTSRELASFQDIFTTLEQHNFQIMAGVDSPEISSFSGWVELSQQSVSSQESRDECSD
jgi:hypothetical protein